MAVKVDRLILRSSSDDKDVIIQDISLGGVSAIKYGELIVGIKSGQPYLYTIDVTGQGLNIPGYRIAPDIYYNDVDLLVNAESGNFDKSVNNIISTAWDSFRVENAGIYGDYGFAFNAVNVPSQIRDSRLDVGAIFTAECWVKFNSLSTKQGLFGYYGTNAIIDYGVYYDNTSGQIKGEINTTIGQYIVSHTASVSTNTWIHVALVKDGDTLTLFVDGVPSTTSSVSGTFLADSVSANYFTLGKLRGYVSTAQSFLLNGNIDDFRLTKDIARYGNAFTPPQKALSTTFGEEYLPVLNLLQNVNITNPQNNQTLTYINNKWVNSSTPSGSIEAFPDVTFTGLAKGDYLFYDGSTWVNKPVRSGWFIAGDGGDFDNGTVASVGNYSLDGGLFN